MKKNGRLFSELQLHVGIRMIKTALAVFVCAVFGWLRDSDPVNAMIAALICMDKDLHGTRSKASNRIIATLIGGCVGLIFLGLAELLHIRSIPLLYYLMMSVMLFPIFLLTINLKVRDSAALGCVILIIMAVNHEPGTAAVVYALNRLVDTLFGIIVTLFINLLIAPPEDVKELDEEFSSIASSAAESDEMKDLVQEMLKEKEE